VSVVEVTMFRLAEGVTDDEFLALDRRIQTELIPNRSGFLRRTTARHGGDWLVVTLWATAEEAAAYQIAVEHDPLQLEFDHAVESGTLHLARYTTLD
jgi:hypothetical protein